MNDKPIAVVPQYAPPVQSYSFDQMQKMAVSFAKSGLFGVKDSDQAFSLLMYGQALGKHPAVIMMDYDLINNRLAKKSGAMLRDFQKSGGRVDWKKYDDTGCIGVFTHPLSPTPVTVDWDIERAKKAGLASKNGDMYGKYTRAMFRSRCISEGVRTTAPDATELLYTPEEIRAMAMDEGDAPVSIQEAVTTVTDKEMPKEELDGYIDALDVKTREELVAAWNAAWPVIRERASKRQQEAYRNARDSMLTEIESQII